MLAHPWGVHAQWDDALMHHPTDHDAHHDAHHEEHAEYMGSGMMHQCIIPLPMDQRTAPMTVLI